MIILLEKNRTSTHKWCSSKNEIIETTAGGKMLLIEVRSIRRLICVIIFCLRQRHYSKHGSILPYRPGKRTHHMLNLSHTDVSLRSNCEASVRWHCHPSLWRSSTRKKILLPIKKHSSLYFNPRKCNCMLINNQWTISLVLQYLLNLRTHQHERKCPILLTYLLSDFFKKFSLQNQIFFFNFVKKKNFFAK